MKKICFSLTILTTLLHPCTGINIDSEDSGAVFARTIEYGESDLLSKLVISPKNKTFSSLLPNTKDNGLKWTAKYGYVGISVMDDRFIAEGMNEAGLSAGLFYFPHYGSLSKYDKKHKDKSLVDMQFISYLLSSYKNVDEVKKGIKNITLVNIGYNKDGSPLPTAHYRVGDSSGKSIVIEIINGGEVMIYDNKVGVLTNSPDFTWHVKNLNNYINLSAGNSSEYESGEKIFSFGAGTAALGLPGDITPPSRFVRAFFYKSTMPTPKTSKDAVKNAFVILNNFEIPIWIEYSKEHQNYIPKELISATQWTSASDLKQKAFYYKTANNAQVRKIDLSKINFSKTSYKVLPLDEEDGIKELDIK